MTLEQKRLDGISILRLIATLGIMFFHIGFGHYYFKFLNPDFGVHLFLCISAFLFMYTTQTKTAGVFLKNRLIRIVPLYAILTVLTYLASNFLGNLYPEKTTTTDLIKSLLFIPYSRGSLKGGDAVRPIVGPAWTLYYDIWFTFVFALAMKISKKWRGLIASCVCIVFYVLGEILPKGYAISHYLNVRLWLDFIAGISVFYIWKYLSQKISSRAIVLSGIIAVLSILTLYMVPIRKILLPLISLVILISTLLSTVHFRAPKFLNWFSNLSYSFYLVHYYVIIILGKVFNFTVFSGKTVVGSILVLGISLLISTFSYKIVEIWLSKILKRWLIEKPSAKAKQ